MTRTLTIGVMLAGAMLWLGPPTEAGAQALACRSECIAICKQARRPGVTVEQCTTSQSCNTRPTAPCWGPQRTAEFIRSWCSTNGCK